MSQITNLIANTAFSFTLSGNSGISPFLTMFLIGIAGKISPEYLNLDETMSKIMTSWPSLLFWSITTILESVGKCVPVLDQIMDSVEAFIVPVLSTLGTCSAFGSFDSDSDSSTASNNNEDNGDRKLRGLSTESTSSIAHGINTFFRIILVFFGIILALSIHFFKMMIRLLGEGCLTQCITVLEATIVCTSVLVSIFVRQFAIFTASCMLFAAGYNAKKKWDKWQKEKEEQQSTEQQQQQRGRSVDDNKSNAVSTPSAVTGEYVKMEAEQTGVPETLGSAQV